jgi:hypothetical protein
LIGYANARIRNMILTLVKAYHVHLTIPEKLSRFDEERRPPAAPDHLPIV